MDAVEPINLWKEQEKQRQSTEIGRQSSSWRRRGESIGQQALAEIPYEETTSSPQFKRAPLEEPLEDEQEENWAVQSRTDRSEDILMTKTQGAPNKRQYDREISIHQLLEEDVPLCTKKRNVSNGTRG